MADLPDADMANRRTVTYKTIGELTLDLHIFTPSASAAGQANAAIVFFHGGGWNGGKPDQFFRHCQLLAARGMVAMSAQYRLKSVHGTTPRESLQDAKSAVRWIRAHAQELAIDPDRLAAGGGSAGGHLAAATATVSGFNEPDHLIEIDCRPNALVLFNPAVDTVRLDRPHLRELGIAFSPLHNIGADMPPTLFLHGTEDGLIPLSTVDAFAARMAEHGRSCKVVLYEGQGHGFFNQARYDETVQEMLVFLTSLGYCQAATTT